MINLALSHMRIDILKMVWLSGCHILFSKIQATVMKHSNRKQIDFEIVEEMSYFSTPELQKSGFTKCLSVCMHREI